MSDITYEELTRNSIFLSFNAKVNLGVGHYL
nr:MAG TPA: hypothetical protein [Bacteriophage sp.]